MKLRDLCDGIVADVDGCLGCAVVDLSTGLPLAMQVVPGTLLNPAAMEVMSAASVDYFRGRTVWQLELAMSNDAAGMDSTAGFVREIQTTTEDTYHFMSVVPGRKDTLLILITDKTANLGLGWIAMRQALARIAEVDAGDLPVVPPAPAEPAAETWARPAPAAPDPRAAPPPQQATNAPVYVHPAGDGQVAPLGGDHPPAPQGAAGVPPQQDDDQELFRTRWRGGHGLRGHPTTH